MLIAFTSCNNQPTETIGKYVYIDIDDNLHADRNCKHIADDHGAKPVRFCPTNTLSSDDFIQVCSQCVTDSLYEQIQQQLKISENRVWLYNALKKEGYNVGKDYGEFSQLMESNDESRRWCYDKLIEIGYVLEYSVFCIVSDYVMATSL